MHPIVVRSTCLSQDAQKHTRFGTLLEVEMSKNRTPLWREAHFQVQSAENWRSRSTSGSWDVEKAARRCGGKHISKSKCSRHNSLGPLLEVKLSKKRTPLWREAHFQVKMYKARDSAPRKKWSKHEAFVAVSTTTTTLHYTTLHSTSLHYTTLHYTQLHCTTLHYTTQTTTFNLQLQLQVQVHYITLHYITLHYLHYTTLATLHYTAPHYTTLHYTTLHWATLHLATLHWLHYTPLHSTTLHHTPLHSTPHITTLTTTTATTTPTPTLHYTTLH